nr:hypothetical protein [Tanacetum cinerariifolium]
LLPTCLRQMMSTLGKESLWLPDISIMKKYDYDHLEEIEARREDRKLYKFREGNKDGISAKEEMKRFRQTKGSGYDLRFRQAALREQVDVKFKEDRKESLWLPDISIMKKYDYDHLEEIEARREDRKLYKFREGNKDGISAKEEMKQFRQTKGSGYDLRFRQAALREQVDVKFKEDRW